MVSSRVAIVTVVVVLIVGATTASTTVNGTNYRRLAPQAATPRNETSCEGKFCSHQTSNGRGQSGAGMILGGNRALRSKEILKHTSVIYGLISIAEPDELSERCYDELQQIYEGIQQKEIWALKVLDASGVQEPGFMWGHNHWIGSEKGCEAAQEPLSITISDRYRRFMKPNLVAAMAPFDVGYRMVYARHQSAWQVEMKFQSENVLHIGVCVPRSCSNGELFNLTARYFDEGIVQAQDIFEFQPNVLQVKDLQLGENFWFKPSVFIIGLSLAVTALMVFLAQAREQKTETEDKQLYTSYSPLLNGGERSSSGTGLAHSNNNNNNNNAVDDGDDQMKETLKRPAVKVSSFTDKVIDSFNVRKNLASVFRTDIGPQSLPVICGIKSISCFLILCFHIQWYTFFSIHNSGVMFHHAEQIRYQLVSNAPLLVDVFFAISGFLVAYNFVRNRDKVQEIKANGGWQNAKLYGKMLLHRYLRLTPLYLLISTIGELMTSYIVDTSKFFVHERSDLTCQRYWWRNVLYIQNLFNIEELCLNWTWSLACEMQYYIISTALLFVYAKNAKLGKWIYQIAAVATLVFSLAITMMHHFVPSYDVLYNTGSVLYIAPWTRISPYVVGVYFGWLLAATRGKLDVTKEQYRKYWVLACVAITVSMHCTIKRNFPFLLASTVMVMVRLFVAWAACWTIVATATGYTNSIIRFLSSRFFIHINKLTYGIYLLNPLIITALFGGSDGSISADPILAMVMALGVAVLSYVAAVAFTVLFEIPYCRISSEILKLKKKPPMTTTTTTTMTTAASSGETPAKKVD